MLAYRGIVKDVLEHGRLTKGRNGNTLHLFGGVFRHDLSKNFPVVTIKPLYFKTMVKETLWFLKGTGDTSYLEEHNVKIWEKWTHPQQHTVGPMYGTQLRNRMCVGIENTAQEAIDRDRTKEYKLTDDGENAIWKIDQLNESIRLLKENPFSRRNVITLWDPSTVAYDDLSPIENIDRGLGALALCHGTVIQFDVLPMTDQDGSEYLELSMNMYQRSCDVLVGLPFNIAQYALLTHMVAHLVNMVPGKLNIFLGNYHIYENQIEPARALLKRMPFQLPKLLLSERCQNIKNIDEFQPEDFSLLGYKSHPKMDIIVTE